MELVQKAIAVENRYDYFKMHIDIVEVFWPYKLTEKQKEVLISYMMVEPRRDVMFITNNRKTVRKMLNDMSNASMSNYLGQLEEKGYLYKNEVDMYMMHKAIVPATDGLQTYQFKLEVNGRD